MEDFSSHRHSSFDTKPCFPVERLSRRSSSKERREDKSPAASRHGHGSGQKQAQAQRGRSRSTSPSMRFDPTAYVRAREEKLQVCFPWFLP